MLHFWILQRVYMRVQWFSLLSPFWEYLPFPAFRGIQGLRNCKKNFTLYFQTYTSVRWRSTLDRRHTAASTT
jgi:hypothetical protein